MIRTFNRSGIHFQYPGNWTLEEVDSDPAGWSVSIQSPDTAFLLISLLPDAIDRADVADQAFAALQSEYKDLESESVVDQVAGLLAIGHNIDFMTLDSTISCQIRGVETPAGPLLLMSQSSDFDPSGTDQVLKAIFASLKVDDD